MKQNPFSFYDFLGYMIPGAVLVYVAVFSFGFYGLVENLSLDSANNSAASQLLSFIPAVIFSYLLGHVLAIFSSAFIEAFSTYSNGYPSQFLFNAKKKCYICGKTFRRTIGRAILWVIVLPISLSKLVITDILGIKVFKQAKPLPEPLRTAAFNGCKRVLSDCVNVDTSSMCKEKGIEGDYLRLLYHFVFEQSDRHSGKLQNYVALYGLTRNVSFVFVLLFWGSVYAYFFDKSMGVGIYHVCAFVVLAYIFYIGFVKFYRRYSLEAIMAATIYQKHDG
ncbi:hypothetical protein [Salinivibrio proteolyticus]|uniref:hypothetical protein n=1 Tax=Salinivibrio proteolyticus TaxID=334715 RepID=UPI0009892D43|nr:hypothetical protein [Salinivibrio proteolyticus]OOF28942.1 hypothetical protein BZJ20_15535 [Salinivibrio proteolyticus]